MAEHVNAGQVGESVRVSRHDAAASRLRCGGDQQVVSTSRSAPLSNLDQQRGMYPGDLQIVGNDRNRVEGAVDEQLARNFCFAFAEFDPDE